MNAFLAGKQKALLHQKIPKNSLNGLVAIKVAFLRISGKSCFNILCEVQSVSPQAFGNRKRVRRQSLPTLDIVDFA